MRRRSGAAFLGPEGTFSHEAAVVWAKKIGVIWGQGELKGVEDLSQVVALVKRGEVGAGVVPVENSIEGSVHLTLDLLWEEEVQVVGEVILPIHHCLLSLSPEREIMAIASHPHALAQCRRFLEARFPGIRRIALSSTAEAARVASCNPHWGAIASSFAARIYQVPVLYRNIEDYPENKTRFFILGYETPPLPGPYKTSLVVSPLANRPGSLYEILKEFAQAGIDLTRIESRPTKKELGEYLFYIDCVGAAGEEPLKSVLARLKEKTRLFKVLGSYAQDRG